MSFIDIAIVFDTTNLTRNVAPGTLNAPALVGQNNAAGVDLAKLIFMMVHATHLADPATQGTANLHVRGSSGDTIRWRTQSLRGQDGDAVIINKIVEPLSNLLRSTPPLLYVPSVPVPLPNQDDPLTFNAVTQSDPRWHSTLLSHGTIQYEISFHVLRYEAGAFNTVGYYQWHPIVTISPRE